MSSDSVPRIFIVHDEHVIASSLASILKRHGYSATSFTSPLETLTAAQLAAPDLLLSAVATRGLLGVDLAIQVKAQCPECKVLLFSTSCYLGPIGSSPAVLSVIAAATGALATQASSAHSHSLETK